MLIDWQKVLKRDIGASAQETHHAEGSTNDKQLRWFYAWIYFVIDGIWFKITPFFKHPGSKPDCSDSELLAMVLIGECRGWDVDTEMLSYWQENHDLFPKIPTQNCFIRRYRALM